MSSIADLIEDIHLVAGVFVNIILLYAIRRFSRFGTYKYLLAIFASFDVFLSLVHGVTKPKVVIVPDVWGVVTDTVLQDRRIAGVYCALFTVPFGLMNIHFLYRYWAIRHPNRIAWFSNMKFVAFVTALPVAFFISWYLIDTGITSGQESWDGKLLLADVYERRYGKRLDDGWILLNFQKQTGLRIYAITAMLFFDIVMAASFSLALTLAALTYHHISKVDQNISAHMVNLQFKLFIAVCAQTFVPLIFVYIPYLGINHLSFLGLPGYSIDVACMHLTACFPAWDAVIIIVLIRDYREGLLSLLFKKKSATHSQTTTWNNVSTVLPLSETATVI